jgi:hypothetical protein
MPKQATVSYFEISRNSSGRLRKTAKHLRRHSHSVGRALNQVLTTEEQEGYLLECNVQRQGVMCYETDRAEEI